MSPPARGGPSQLKCLSAVLYVFFKVDTQREWIANPFFFLGDQRVFGGIPAVSLEWRHRFLQISLSNLRRVGALTAWAIRR